jgi:hypothetical protein
MLFKYTLVKICAFWPIFKPERPYTCITGTILQRNFFNNIINTQQSYVESGEMMICTVDW